MFWGCFSTTGVGALVRVNGIMKEEDYRDIFEENMKQSAKNLGMGRWIFKDPKHTTKFVSKWLADERVNVLP